MAPMLNIAAGINLGLASAGIAILYMLYRDYRVDRLRDELFAMRDSLFDYACEQDLLNHEAYKQLRSIINSMLRFGHKVTFARFLLVALLLGSRKPMPNPYGEWKVALATVPRNQADKLEEYHGRMWGLIVLHMCETSAIMLIIGLFFRLKKFIRKVGGRPNIPFLRGRDIEQQIEAQAVAFRG